MANIYTTQRLVDTQDKAVIKLTARFADGGDENQLKIDVSDLAYALNANGYIMTGGADPKSIYRTFVTAIIYDVNIASGYLAIKWQGAENDNSSNTDMYIMHSGQHSALFDDMRYVGVLKNPTELVDSANTTGDIYFETVGAAANDSYTVIISLKKDARDYDKGQTADPTAFNRGPAAP
jgi:hypothetical protein